jgi:hypothetical protein
MLVRGRDAVYLSNVARGQLLNAVAVSYDICWGRSPQIGLLCKGDGSRQRLCLIHLAQLRQHVDLLYSNW